MFVSREGQKNSVTVLRVMLGVVGGGSWIGQQDDGRLKLIGTIMNTLFLLCDLCFCHIRSLDLGLYT
jgi:hypothetical protein